MSLLLTILQESLLFFPLVSGIYLSYKILNTTDLTVDGSFVLGAGGYAKMLSLGYSIYTSFLFAILLGAFTGVVVSLFQYKKRITGLIAGILALFMLQSINFSIMGRPNISVQPNDNITTFIIIYSISIFISLSFLLHSSVGLNLRAAGNNSKIFTQQLGKNYDLYNMFGLGISNSLAASCGALTSQINGYADLHMGFGVTLIGIGSVVIGIEIFKKNIINKNFNAAKSITSCLFGVIIYFSILHLLLKFGIEPIYLKFFLGLLLLIFLRGKTK